MRKGEEEIPDDIDEDDVDEYREAKNIKGSVQRGSRGARLLDKYDLWDKRR